MDAPVDEVAGLEAAVDRFCMQPVPADGPALAT
jgi:hypothetical protein